MKYSVALTKTLEGTSASLCTCMSSSQACPGTNRKFDLSQKLEIKWLICLQSETEEEMLDRANAWSYKVLLWIFQLWDSADEELSLCEQPFSLTAGRNTTQTH